MIQDEVFYSGEGDSWFERNKQSICQNRGDDLPFQILKESLQLAEVKSVLEVGCANGWRLNLLSEMFPDATFSGMDASLAAIEDGKKRYPGITLTHGLLSEIPFEKSFDLVIVNFVLHWVDRSSLIRSVSEIDRVVNDGGYLLLGDFLPDMPQRRIYHHVDQGVYTYKQDYPQLFKSLGTYQEAVRKLFNHDDKSKSLAETDASSRAVCSLLAKSLSDYYMESE
ncbi:class I SAM-dependent methyltransferase [Mariprofundus sp. NF]|uniref:class I SAM-dependent methyltransferase n=1 Tax=Mariprofundus sp. NF TaxID=2608716 RepID=UPI0015A29CF8|nr:class I SAM-dependent methyltransferase [Mariprofundus sp. NF]NWF37921.1 class I SAM-dependent methyltransferase [Mariprofundus sp. NF]